MSVVDYRANLEACRRMAEKAPNESEKRTWLDMAESWRLLIITHDSSSTNDPSSSHYDFSVTSNRNGHRFFENDSVQIVRVRHWLTQRVGRYFPEFDVIREKAKNLLDAFLNLNHHRRRPPARQTAPRRRFRSRFLDNTLANAARRTLARRRA